jgi:hypothetical protein
LGLGETVIWGYIVAILALKDTPLLLLATLVAGTAIGLLCNWLYERQGGA